METQREIDEVLVARFQAGEDRAFDLLGAEYRRPSFRVVLRIIDERSGAEDVLQYSLIRTAKNPQALRRYGWVELNEQHEEQTDYRIITVDNDSPLSILANKQTFRVMRKANTALPAMIARPLMLCELVA